VAKQKRRVVPFSELGDGGQFMEHVNSALSCALVGGACIENALGSLLELALIDDDASRNLLNGPKEILSTYAARADLCFCLGLIPSLVHRNAKTIGKIRNTFAHSHEAIDFSDGGVDRLCGQLDLTPMVGVKGPFDWEAYSREQMSPEENEHERESLATNKFILAVTATHMAIVAAAADVRTRAPVEYQIACLSGGRAIAEDGSLIDDPDAPAPIVFFTRPAREPGGD